MITVLGAPYRFIAFFRKVSAACLTRVLVLLECAENHPQVLSDPEPFVYFADFADSSLNLELRVFIRDANNSLLVRNDTRFKIFSALKKAGIEIPFPQRDIHIRSGGIDEGSD